MVQSPFFHTTGYIWFLSVRSICHELCYSRCGAAGGLGPWNTRETSAKQWMMDDSGKLNFDKAWEVKGSDESKITDVDLQGLKSWLVEQSLYFVTRQTKLLIHWFLSQQPKECPLKCQKWSFILSQVYLLSADCSALFCLNDEIRNLIKPWHKIAPL